MQTKGTVLLVCLLTINHNFQGFFAVKRRAVFILLAMPPPSLGRAALVMWCGWFKPRLEIRHATALTTGAKHWHRKRLFFLCFCFSPPVFFHWTKVTQQQTSNFLKYNKNVAKWMISPCQFTNKLYQLLKDYLKSCGINNSEYWRQLLQRWPREL